MSQIDVPELVKTISEKLEGGHYECVVCTEQITVRDRLWSCRTCFGVFHLPCIVYWCKSQADQQRTGAQHHAHPEGGDQIGEFFRCPLCQGKSAAASTAEYRCFCSKVKNPKGELGLVPGSCGQQCGKRRLDAQCPHTCGLLCHPGPCPQCPQSRPQGCFCGAEEKQVGCSSGLEGYECGNICGKELSCGRHYCESLCHSGPCASCDISTKVSCFCGGSSREMKCAADMTFSCRNPCPKKKDCGLHDCEQLCHEGSCTMCLRTPARQSSCPCGQTPLWKIYFKHPDMPPRNSCLDPVPTCQETCSIPLMCGQHLCSHPCHDTPSCPPCMEISSFSCSCGSSSKKFPCFVQYVPQEEWLKVIKKSPLNERHLPPEFPFRCQKKCKKPLSCGRHACEEVCCTNEDHVCYQVCRKRAPCGIHECGQLCHRGMCPPCMNNSYDRLYCRCRRTYVEPPVPCGTPPPNCAHPCVVPRPCGHPANHACHHSGECPDCAVPVSKLCASHGLDMPYAMPCHMKNVSCGRKCAKVLSCCNKVCTKVCHGGPCVHECNQSFPELPPAKSKKGWGV